MKPILSESNKDDLNSYLNIQPIRKKNNTKINTSNKAINNSINKENISNFPSLYTKTLIDYKPKRLVNFLNTAEMPLKEFGRRTFNYSNTFLNPKTLNSSKDLNKNECDFRTNYVIKFSQIAEELLKTTKYKKLILLEAKQQKYNNTYQKLKKEIDLQSRIFFDDRDFLHNNLNFLKNIIPIIYEYNMNLIKYINYLGTELTQTKQKNMELLKKNYEQDIKLVARIKEIQKLNIFLNRYDIKNQIILKQSKEESVGNLKQVFSEKENLYLISIYKLEQEIKDLTNLLDMNKDIYFKYKESEKKNKINQSINDEMRFAFNKELHDRNIDIAIEKDKQEELIIKIKELEKSIENLKVNEEQHRRDKIEISATIKKLNMNLDEKNECLKMLNEECEDYYIKYINEKNNHNNTIIALHSLENKLLKVKENQNNNNQIQFTISSNNNNNNDNKEKPKKAKFMIESSKLSFTEIHEKINSEEPNKTRSKSFKRFKTFKSSKSLKIRKDFK